MKANLIFIIDFDQMDLNIAGSQGYHIKLLSKHSATTKHYTCNGIDGL